ncbi:hypothetical protein HDU81_009393 [Chytriomyces hyalinus]|nr:hypothetical protein HDU81_009393 [Chytriomyces hyalinus]
MTTRTFIHDCLYNPNYGYFSRNARILHTQNKDGIAFNSLKDSVAFSNHLANLYSEFEEAGTTDEQMRQVWHTPTELFKPHYGNAVANYILKDNEASGDVQGKLKIYEIGAGNGTLARNILDAIQTTRPDVYSRLEYTIVEISAKLSAVQKLAVGKQHSDAVVRFVNQSVFDWNAAGNDSIDTDPCYFIAMEVVDNFAHDLVRYMAESGDPVQGVVLVDEDGDYQEAYEPLDDPLIRQYLELRNSWTGGKRPPVVPHPMLQTIKSMLPFSTNLTKPEFLPTMLMVFMEKLHRNFPNHRLILSDFDSLPEAIPGHTAPVVQTRYKGTMVACSTYLVQPGFFDIFFPTDFKAAAKMYQEIGRRERLKRGVSSESKQVQVVTQRDFLKQNALNLDLAKTRNGECPMLDFYQNFRFLLTR